MSAAGDKFDVPAWLATLTGLERTEIELRDQSESAGRLSSTYFRGPRRLATVTLAALPLDTSGRSSWQIVAQLGERIESVQMPPTTRFLWR